MGLFGDNTQRIAIVNTQCIIFIPNLRIAQSRGIAMKAKIVLALVAASMASSALAGSTSVRGYVRKDGTYVAPHQRSTPDSNPYNNWSTKPNINPYTGKSGTVEPYQSYTPRPTYRAPSYPSYEPYSPPKRSSGYSTDLDDSGYSDDDE